MRVRNIKPSRKKRLDELEFLVGKRRYFMCHRWGRNRFSLSIPIEDALFLNLVNHDRSRNHVPQSAILFVDRTSDASDQIETNRIDRPHEVSSYAFKHGDGPPARAYDPDFCQPLTRSLPIPHNFEDRKVAPVKTEEE